MLDRVSRTTSLPGDEDSVIDLEVVSPLLVPICRWVVLVYYCSDHRLCTTLVQLYITTGRYIVNIIRQKKRKKHMVRRQQHEIRLWWSEEEDKE